MLKNLFRRQKQKDSQPGTPTLDQQPSEKVSPSPSETSDFVSTAEISNKKKSWFQRLTTGLSKTRKNLVNQIANDFRKTTTRIKFFHAHEIISEPQHPVRLDYRFSIAMAR